ncbi:DUF427 domain-containing protein [Demequina globuliformis]|uniref:DUF427 domain-containing protein n=1 Tax=Demequina globuliformis TaxID=676202 RepID=UPI0007867E5B|nr:DUF427 domain-containing protein [Demequina globuliformis]
MKAVWNGAVIAQSDQTVVVEGNHYFPLDSVNTDYLSDSDMVSKCPWKGEASYWSITVDGETNPDAVWIYRDPKPRADMIRDHVAFWRGVDVVED